MTIQIDDGQSRSLSQKFDQAGVPVPKCHSIEVYRRYKALLPLC